MGLCSYYRRFIPNFSECAHPLHDCACTVPFRWTAAADSALERLKRALTQALILTYPNKNAMFILDTDASNYGIGAVLSQVSNPTCDTEQEAVIAYYSSTLSRAEQQYCVNRRELLAVVKAVKHFHVYLHGRKFVLRTDHSALQWLLNFRQPEASWKMVRMTTAV